MHVRNFCFILCLYLDEGLYDWVMLYNFVYDLVCGTVNGPYKNCVPAKNTFFWDVMPNRIIKIC